ncbi:MAG: TerC family protein [Actinomycetota bacterium]
MTNAPWYLYLGFLGFVVAVLLLDLRLFHSKEREPRLRESATWVAIWVALAVGFGVALLAWKGGRAAGEFFAGYLVEYSLSVDNMFVFVVIFSYFRVPKTYQHQVLFYGILGAIVSRGIFIAAGAALINQFHWVVYVFGALLLFTAVRLARGVGEVHPENNPVLRLAERFFPATRRYHGQRLFTMENGRRVMTPLFITLLIVETTDILFAVDSIPAIFGITRDPFIVLTSNVFAVLGLRALYFLLAGSMDRFHLLKYGLSAILGFVGVKMLLPLLHEVGLPGDFEIPIWVSLAVIVGVLALTVALSLVLSPRGGVAPPEPAAPEGAGEAIEPADVAVPEPPPASAGGRRTEDRR